jgi:hypothetical protein
MKAVHPVIVLLLMFIPAEYAAAGSVEFELIVHPNNMDLLPQPYGLPGVVGDHLLQTADDITGGTFNPNGCLSFNFMNPVGISEPCYPPGYAEGIHSMVGSIVLDVDLQNGGPLGIESLAFGGYVAPSKSSSQYLVEIGDPATGHNTDGMPNGGTYIASAGANWAFQAIFDWYYDTPFAGSGTIDITFDNYRWDGFIIPVGELTPAGMGATELDDPLGFFGGTSEDFEAWLLGEVAPQLPPGAVYLLFAQGRANPAWCNSSMGMQLEGVVEETIIGYAVPQCGDPNHPYPPGDLNRDCSVDLRDFAMIALHWLENTAP